MLTLAALLEYTWKGTTGGGEQLVKIGKLHWANLAGNEKFGHPGAAEESIQDAVSISPC